MVHARRLETVKKYPHFLPKGDMYRITAERVCDRQKNKSCMESQEVILISYLKILCLS